ncbi:MAG: hypothetical protein AAF652_16260 [Cyanobacteria bacterium P01_C01_bin.72]
MALISALKILVRNFQLNHLMQLKRIKNIPHKLRRELYKIPAFHALKENAYQKAISYHAQFLPLLDQQGKSIVNTLRREGTCIVSLDEMKLSATQQMMSTAYYLANKLKTPSELLNAEKCEVGAAKKDLREFAEIVLWALEPKLLNIVENYIGLPILYQGFAVRRSIADGQYSGVRRWHMDWEDRRTIKIIIYLNDVVAGGGPYEYIRRSTTEKAIKTLNYYNLGYLSDVEMCEAVSPIDWTACLGKEGSMIITDTSSVFHRAQPPKNRERFSITFCYTSANPQVIWKSRKMSRQEWEQLDSLLDQRQVKCLTKRRFD